MSLAYVVVAHRLPGQLGRLVRALDPARSPVLIHVDARTDEATWQAMRRELAGEDGVTWLRRRPIRWAGWGSAAAALDGLRAVVERDLPADHVALLSGQDYPVRSAAAIDAFLDEHRGESFLHWNRVPPAGTAAVRGGFDAGRWERWWFQTGGALRSLPARRRLPDGLGPYGGLAFWCLARPAAELVVGTLAQRPEIERFFRHVAVPDEHVVHSLLVPSALGPTLRNEPLRWVDFPPGAARPRVLTMDDVPVLAALPPTGLWARKFDATVDAEVLDAVDALRARR